MSNSRVVVIGSGPGGSAFAALMAHAGHSVTILERNAFPGGKCSSLCSGSYVLDTGVHMFARGPLGPFGDISRILGEGPRWSRTLPSFSVNPGGRGNLEMSSSLIHPLNLLSFVNGHMHGWLRMKWMGTAASALRRWGPSGLLSLGGKFHDRRYPLYSELQEVTVREFMTSLSNSQDFLRVFHAQAMLTMAIPWQRASMGEYAYILGSTMHAANLCYPFGGSGAIPAAFLRSLQRHGGEIRLNCEVTEVRVEGGRARGVITGSGESIPADLVVSSAGTRRTAELAGRDNLPASYLQDMERMRDSEAFIAVKFLLDRKVTSLRTPCLLRLPDLPAESMFDYLESGGMPDDLFLFVTVPGRWDPSLVPPGGDAILVGVPASMRLDRRAQSEGILDLAERIVLETFPEIARGTVDIQRIYARDISGLSGRAGGDCIGLAQEVGQSGSERPDQATPITGLFLVGGDAGGRGIGTEMAADSALRLYYHLKDGWPRGQAEFPGVTPRPMTSRPNHGRFTGLTPRPNNGRFPGLTPRPFKNLASDI